MSTVCNCHGRIYLYCPNYEASRRKSVSASMTTLRELRDKWCSIYSEGDVSEGEKGCETCWTIAVADLDSFLSAAAKKPIVEAVERAIEPFITGIIYGKQNEFRAAITEVLAAHEPRLTEEQVKEAGRACYMRTGDYSRWGEFTAALNTALTRCEEK